MINAELQSAEPSNFVWKCTWCGSHLHWCMEWLNRLAACPRRPQPGQLSAAKAWRIKDWLAMMNDELQQSSSFALGPTGAPVNGAVMANAGISVHPLLHVSQPAELLPDGLFRCERNAPASIRWEAMTGGCLQHVFAWALGRPWRPCPFQLASSSCQALSKQQLLAQFSPVKPGWRRNHPAYQATRCCHCRPPWNQQVKDRAPKLQLHLHAAALLRCRILLQTSADLNLFLVIWWISE